MQYTTDDYNNLSYFLSYCTISYDEVIDWAFRQYTSEGVDPFIEKIALASDKEEIISLIADEYGVYGKIPSEFEVAEFWIGEIAADIEDSTITLYKGICEILFDIDSELLREELSKEELINLYTAHDYYDWHDTADIEGLKLVLPILTKYKPIYQNAIAKFITKFITK